VTEVVIKKGVMKIAVETEVRIEAINIESRTEETGMLTESGKEAQKRTEKIGMIEGMIEGTNEEMTEGMTERTKEETTEKMKEETIEGMTEETSAETVEMKDGMRVRTTETV